MRWRPWSLQKNGTGAYVAGSAPFGRRPAGCGRRAAPCSAALVQCSTRISSPNRRFGQRAHVAGGPHAGRRRPACRRRRRRRAARARCPPASPVAGATPMPTTITSAGTSSPPASVTPSTPRPSTSDAAADVDAVGGVHAPWRPGPSRRRGRGSAATGRPSSTVTAQPRARAVAATSRPMNPAPTTTTRAVPSAIRSRRRERVVERAQLVDGRRRPPGPAGASSPSRWR